MLPVQTDSHEESIKKNHNIALSYLWQDGELKKCENQRFIINIKGFQECPIIR